MRKQALSSFLVTLGSTAYAVFKDKEGGFASSEAFWSSILRIKGCLY